jgi:hypothetical protein
MMTLKRYGDAWSYSRDGDCESWCVLAHKEGTAGTLDTWLIAIECRDCQTGEVTLEPTDSVWVGSYSYADAYEYAYGEEF